MNANEYVVADNLKYAPTFDLNANLSKWFTTSDGSIENDDEPRG